MAPLRTFVLPAFVAVAAAQSISDYVPACGTTCIADTVDKSTTCSADDGACICAQVYTVKRNAEVCLRDGCSDSDYGNVMSGYDKFCAAVGDGPSPTTTSSTEAPPSSTDAPSSTPYETTTPPTTTSTSGYETSAPPESTTSEVPTTSGYETSAPPPETTSSSVETTSEYQTSEVPTSYPTLTSLTTSIIETYSTAIPTTEVPTTEVPPTSDYPTEGPAPTPSTNGTITTGYPTSAPTSEPTGEPTIIPQPGAGARFEMNAGIYLGAALIAGGLAVFGF